MTLSQGTPLVAFVETARFTALITELLADEEYAVFQQTLARSPGKGILLQGCGGVRKIRMAAKGKGKSGGARILYLYIPNRSLIYLLSLFTKGDADNISAQGKKAIARIAQEIKNEYR